MSFLLNLNGLLKAEKAVFVKVFGLYRKKMAKSPTFRDIFLDINMGIIV